MTHHPSPNDRNFDELTEHFAHKIYGGLKGQIRLAVLKRDLSELLANKLRLKVLDIGAGLGQLSLHLAKLGHDCTLTDISSNMLEYAKACADEQSLSCRFVVAPYQELDKHLNGQDGQFDVILCHALLEWVENPQELMAVFDQFLAKNGVLSLCFYNPVAPIYRNLIMGNFNYLNNPKPADKGSLTPNHPVAYDTVKSWLKDYTIISESGIRVFYDYTTHKRGGLAHSDAVIDMELHYSRLMPYRLMGRYLHILASR